MDDDEDHGESLAVNGRTVVVNGHGKRKGGSKFKELQLQRAQLPIAKGTSIKMFLLECSADEQLEGKEALLREIKENDTVVLMGETGSGKTTRTSSKPQPFLLRY